MADTDTNPYSKYVPQDPPQASPSADPYSRYIPHDETKTPPAAEDKPKSSWLTTSVAGRGHVEQVADTVSKGMSALSSVLPAALRTSSGGKWAGDFTQELVKQGGTEALDFATSPAGLALIGVHLFPITAPLAAGADLLMSVGAALRAVPDAASFYRDHSPENAARLAMDLFAAKGMKDIGKARIRSAHVEREAGANWQDIDKVRSIEDPLMKQAALESLREKSGPGKALDKLHNPPADAGKARKGLQAGVSGLLHLTGYPLPRLVQLSADIVRDRNETLQGFEMNRKRTTYFLRREVPAAERDIERLGAVIEGTRTAKEAGLGLEAQQWAERLREHRRKMDVLKRDTYGEEIPEHDADTYLTHIWDFSKESDDVKAKARRNLIHDPFHKQRSIDNYAAGLEMGLKPKFRDVADIIDAHDTTAATAAVNTRMSNILRGMGTVLSEDEYKKFGLSGWNRATEARALDRAVYQGKTAKGEKIVGFRPVMVHPDFEPAVKAIFDEDRPGKTAAAVESIRSVEKKMSLNFSFFHNNALSEASHAVDVFQNPKKLVQDIWVLNPNYWKGIRSGLWDVAERPDSGPIARGIGHALGKDFAHPLLSLKPEVLDPWIRTGAQFGSDESESTVASMLRGWAQKSGPAGAPLKGLADAMHVWDKGLWGFYHPGQMLNALETQFSTEMNRSIKSGIEMSDEQVAQLRRRIADNVNDAFGAVNYQNLLQSPTAIRAMNFMVLAPAWTLSNIRIFSHAFESEAGLRIASRYAKGAAVSWFLTTQALNYANTKYFDMPDKNGKTGGHFTWDNPGAPLQYGTHRIPRATENMLNVAAGYNYNDKGEKTSERYMKLGRAFREPFLWALEPLHTLGGKMGQIPRTLITLWSGSEPGGFEEINKSQEVRGHFMPPGSVPEQSLSYLVKQVTPMGLRNSVQKAEHYLFPEGIPAPGGSQQLFGLPTSPGISYERAIDAYYGALKDNEQEAIVVIESAVQANNLKLGIVTRAVNDRLRAAEKAKASTESEPPPGAR